MQAGLIDLLLGSRDLGTEHEAIVEAVLARDADRASELTERHFALTASLLAEDEATVAEFRGR